MDRSSFAVFSAEFGGSSISLGIWGGVGGLGSKLETLFLSELSVTPFVEG